MSDHTDLPGVRSHTTTTQRRIVRVADLEFVTPDCPDCGVATGVDTDAFWCEECGATWNRQGTNGEREATL